MNLPEDSILRMDQTVPFSRREIDYLNARLVRRYAKPLAWVGVKWFAALVAVVSCGLWLATRSEAEALTDNGAWVVFLAFGAVSVAGLLFDLLLPLIAAPGLLWRFGLILLIVTAKFFLLITLREVVPWELLLAACLLLLMRDSVRIARIVRAPRLLRVDHLERFGLLLRRFRSDESDVEPVANDPVFASLLREWGVLKGQRTFDSLLGDAFSDPRFPLVSIGNNEDQAHRWIAFQLYPSDRSRERFLRRLMTSSTFIVFRCDGGESFFGELRLAKELGLLDKSFVSVELDLVLAPFWQHVIQRLEEMGISAPPQYPGRGALLRFHRSSDLLAVEQPLATAEEVRTVLVDQPMGGPVAPTTRNPRILTNPTETTRMDDRREEAPETPPEDQELSHQELAELKAKLWRHVFYKNPFKLGPPGILLALVWLGSCLGVVWAVYANQPHGHSRAITLLALLVLLPLFVLTYSLSGILCAWTERWAWKKGKSLAEAFE